MSERTIQNVQVNLKNAAPNDDGGVVIFTLTRWRTGIKVVFGPTVLEVVSLFDDGQRVVEAWPWENVASVQVVDKAAPLPPPPPGGTPSPSLF